MQRVAVLDTLPDFASLPPAARRDLASAGRDRRLRRGATLFRAGADAALLFIVLEGSVRVVRTSASRRRVVHSEGPGGTLGEIPFFHGGGYPATAIAAEPARVLEIDHRAFGAVLRRHPEVAWLFLARLTGRVRGLIERLDRAQAHDVTGQIARILLARGRGANGAAFALGCTHAEMAEELGTVREVVVRTLRRLRALGALESVGRGRYALANARLLERLAR